jgi:hypothetical protein
MAVTPAASPTTGPISRTDRQSFGPKYYTYISSINRNLCVRNAGFRRSRTAAPVDGVMGHAGVPASRTPVQAHEICVCRSVRALKAPGLAAANQNRSAAPRARLTAVGKVRVCSKTIVWHQGGLFAHTFSETIDNRCIWPTVTAHQPQIIFATERSSAAFGFEPLLRFDKAE